MFSRAALGGIWVYQTYISPRKGFRCAHAVLHGGTGCSGFAKHAITDFGLFAAIPQIRQRFNDCRAAYIMLRENQDVPDRRREDSRKDSCAKRTRDGCFDALGFEACEIGFTCCGRAAARSPQDCDAGCDICSCG